MYHNGEYRTSLVVDLADGRVPFLDHGRSRDIYGQWRARGFGEFDGPEIRPAGERCLSAIGTMPPMALLPYNSNVQIVQNQNYVQVDERYTLVNDRGILCTYTVTDPQIYQQPYSVEMLLHRMEAHEKMYEFACHEDNSSMEIILRGARQQEHDERLRQAGMP